MTRCYCFELTVSRVSPRSNNIPYAVFQYAIGSDNLKRTGTICSISFVQPLNIEKFYESRHLVYRPQIVPVRKSESDGHSGSQVVSDQQMERSYDYYKLHFALMICVLHNPLHMCVASYTGQFTTLFNKPYSYVFVFFCTFLFLF